MKTNYHNFKTIYSTNTWALQNYALFDKEALTIVAADEQSAGRGRLQRTWESPPDLNLYITFCLFVPQDMINIANMPQVLALSCAEMLESLGLSPTLKWPNDILCSNKKMGGIHTETKFVEDLKFVAMGLGLNINMPEIMLKKISKPATSILIETGKNYSISAIQSLLEEKFNQNLSLFFENGFAPFYHNFKAHMDEDKSLQFFDNQNILHGKCSSLNPDGTLSLTLNDGTVTTFCYGEIV